MSDIAQRLREAHPNSAQRFAGSTILLDAADEIERLAKERDYAIRWANKAVEDVKASYEAELAKLRDAVEWCIERNERNGSLPEAYEKRLLDALPTEATLKAEGESR